MPLINLISEGRLGQRVRDEARGQLRNAAREAIQELTQGNRFLSDALALANNPVIRGRLGTRFTLDGVGVGRSALGRGVLTGFNRTAEPQLTYNWSAILPDGFLPMYIKECTIPLTSIESNPYHQRNSKRYDPGFTDVASVQMEFYEDVAVSVSKYLNVWRSKVVDERGYYGLPPDYKKTMHIFRHRPDGRPNVLYKCIGCWPASIDDENFTSSGSEQETLNVTFSTDDVQPNFV